MLNVIMLSVVRMNVVAPQMEFVDYTLIKISECHLHKDTQHNSTQYWYAECHYAEYRK
jgi:hypothetical protein